MFFYGKSVIYWTVQFLFLSYFVTTFLLGWLDQKNKWFLICVSMPIATIYLLMMMGDVVK